MRMVSRSLSGVMLVLSTASITMTQLAVAQIGSGGGIVGVSAGSVGIPLGGIANKPYSATVKTTVVQKLADGTTITRVSTTKEARDSEGRTMHQTSLYVPNGQPAIVNTSVFDPSSRTMTHWMSQSKQATVLQLPEPKSPAANLPTQKTVPAGGPSSKGPADGQSQSATAARAARIRNRQREELGGKTIAGVYAEGTRITMTIPEGAEGNDRPITIVNEIWRAPELDITVLSVTEDPRTGTRTSEVTDLDRAEPNPSVFQVPEGYTVKDQNPGQPQ
jgi:hypothetical protein